MKQIEVGMYARYKNTGTVGKVLALQEEDGIRYALLDSTDLLYDVTFLEQTEKPRERKDLKTDLETARKTETDLFDSLETGEMSESIGGG